MLAEFRRDIREAKYLVKGGLIAAGDRAVGAGQFVLVELETASLRPAAHFDIVVLAPNEVIQGEGKLGVIDHAQVGLHHHTAGADEDADFGIAAAENLDHARQFNQAIHNRLRIVGANK